MSDQKAGPTRNIDSVILVLLLVSLLANVGLVVLWRQSRNISKSQLDAPTLARVGARLDELSLLGLDGNKPKLQFDSQELPIVVYVLSPTCKWCEINRTNVDSLATQINGRYRFIGVSTTSEGLAAYQVKVAPPFPLYYVSATSSHLAIPLDATPQTLVFSPDGRFIQGWGGAYIGTTKAALASFFKVKFPIGPGQ